MIANIGFAFIRSAWGRYIILGLSVLSALAVWGRSRESKGAGKLEGKIRAEIERKTKEGRDAYHEERRKGAGIPVGNVADSLRGRDDRWRGVQGLR